MRTVPNRVRIEIDQTLVDTFVPGCPWNSPVTVALKEQIFHEATEIVDCGDEVYVDGQLLVPTTESLRWMNRWRRAGVHKVCPTVLEFRSVV